MNTVLKFFVRLLLVAAGLVFAASLLVAMVGLLALWGVRAVWCKLTGQPINPFVMRMNPRTGFDQVFKQAERGASTVRKAQRSGMNDVTDVEPKR
jgi:flagellar biosynthesis protein FlhB